MTTHDNTHPDSVPGKARLPGFLARMNARQAFIIFQATLGSLTIGALGLYRIGHGEYTHGLFNLVLVAVLVVMGRATLKGQKLDLITRILAASYMLATLVVVRIAGEPALYWSFVALLATFFAVRAREALAAAAVAFVVIIYLLFNRLDFPTRIAFSSCYVLVSAFAFYFSGRLWDENARLEIEAHRDRLTGLLNRRSYDDAVGALLENRPTDDAPFSLLIIDIDHFKRINDTFGHASGDKALSRAARRLSENLPDTVALYRYGGEEFVALVPENAARTGELGERLRAAMADSHLMRDMDAPVTISVGIAEWRDDDDARSWFQRADQALYLCKESGRNQVRLAA